MLAEACVERISIEIITFFRTAADIAAVLCDGRRYFCVCCGKLRIRYSFQLCHIRKAKLFHHCRNDLGSVFFSCAERILFHNTAHYKTFLEQSVCRRNLHQVGDFHSAAGLAEDGYVLRIAAEQGDVVMYPMQSRYHVCVACIGGVFIFFSKRRQIHIS